MKFRYDATEDLRKSMGSTVVDVTILRAIKQWTEHPTDQLVVSDELVPHQDAALDRAIISQSSIGWTNLFRGLVSNAWGFIYYEDDDECSLQAESSPNCSQFTFIIRFIITCLSVIISDKSCSCSVKTATCVVSIDKTSHNDFFPTRYRNVLRYCLCRIGIKFGPITLDKSLTTK